MGVYIRGMEMPKSCYICPFFRCVPVLVSDDEADNKAFCKLTGATTFDEIEQYLPNCPLVPVPPHGRLIDADALFKEMERKGWWDNNDRDIAEDLTWYAPTIIEGDDS